jgi:AcrR family transcriptional regulator
MGRWQPDSGGRLREVTLALYSEPGFEQTTVAEIADRVGLTERTFSSPLRRQAGGSLGWG